MQSVLKIILNKKGEINDTQIQSLEKHEDCLRFVSANCDYGSMKTKFKKLPETFAKVSSLNLLLFFDNKLLLQISNCFVLIFTFK